MIEIFARSRRSFENFGGGQLGVPVINPSLTIRWLCFVTCLMPVAVGFFVPVLILLEFMVSTGLLEVGLSMMELTQNSFTLAISAAIGVMTVSILVGLLATYRSGQLGRILAGMAASGYAFPGTILAIGVLSFSGFLDQLLGLLLDDCKVSGGWLWGNYIWIKADAAPYDGIKSYFGSWFLGRCTKGHYAFASKVNYCWGFAGLR